MFALFTHVHKVGVNGLSNELADHGFCICKLTPAFVDDILFLAILLCFCWSLWILLMNTA